MVTCRVLSVIIFLFYINLTSCLFDFPPEYQRDNDGDGVGDPGVSSQGPPYYRNENHGCPGCVFDLNPNVFGVSDLVFTALKHIESEHDQKYALVEVKRLQRQITSGVKYILLIDVSPTDCPKNVDQYKAKFCKPKEADTVTCEIELFEKPWISDNKYITFNNCTETQDFVIPQIYHYLRRDDSANEIEGSLKNKRNFNNEMTPDRLTSLESQILADSMNTEGTHIVATEDNPNLATLGNTEGANYRGGFYTEAFPKDWGYSHEDLSVIPLQSSVDDFNLEINTDGPFQKRETRSIGRLEKISPDEKPLVRDLSDYVAAVLDGIDEDNHKRVILQILGAKKSHGKGTNYHLILRLGISHCLEDHIPGVTEKCRQKLFNNLTKICKVQVHLDEDMSNPEIIKSQCQNIKKDENDKNRTNYSRYKRSRLLGAPTTKPNDDPTALEYLKHSLQYFDGAENKYKLKEVTSVTSQVVSGSLWKITAKFSPTECPKDSDKDPQECNELEGGEEKECNLKFWDQPWLQNGLQTTIDCGNGEETYISNTISRKKRGIPGGPSTLPNDDPRALKYIEHSLQFFDTFDTKPKLKEIKSINTQVVQGSLVKITATFVPTNCPKDSDNDIKDCEEQDGGEEKECKLEFWDRSWLENGLQTKIDCGDGEKTHVTNTITRKKRGIPGGPSTLPNDDPRALKYIEHSLQFFETGGTKPKLKEIKSVTTQVVQGSLVKITATFVPTNCPKDSDNDIKDCEEQDGGEEKECKLEFWDRSWLENGLQTKIDCGDGEKTHVTNTITRKKRGIPGGPSTLPNDDPRALKYIEHSLQFFETGGTKPKLKEIKSVTTQVVQGSLVKITATFVPTNCPKDSDNDIKDCEEQDGGEEKECKLEFWDRSWLENGLQTKIDCGDGEKTHVTNTITRKKRGIPGGPSTLPNDDPRALKYIEHSLQFFDTFDTKPKLKEIKSINTQVVQGSLVKITATFVPTNCPKDSDNDIKDCEEQDGGEEKECKLEFWDRSWLENGLQTKIDCGDGEKTHVTNTITRKKRGIPGGPSTLPNDDPRALKYIEHSLQFFETGGTKPKLKEIKSVTTQVVQGSLVKITATFVPTNCPKDSDNDIKDCEEQDGGEEKECKLEFWDRSWLENGLQTKIDCGDGEKTHVTNTITRKKRGIPGGPSTLPNDDPRALKYIEHSLQFFDTFDTKPKLKEIKSVTTQVVQGSLVKITATFVPTNCPKDSDNDIKDCEEQDGGEEKECKLEFWDRSWLENGLQTKIDCGEDEKTHVTNTITRKKRGIPGGPSTLPNDDPRALKYIEHSLQFFETGGTKPKLKEIKSVTTQVVQGSLVKITATFVPTNCPKDSDNDIKDCEEQDGGEEKECKLEFWDRSWLENGLQTKIDCGDGEKTHVTNTITRKKRGIPGGPSTLPSDDPRALKYIEHSLQFFETGGTKPKLKEIKSVTTQVVQGSLVKITATFVPTNCPKDSDNDIKDCEEQDGGEEKECKLEFWDRPWLENGLQTKIDCGDGEKTHVTDTISRKKRGIPGGPSTLPNDDPRALKYIEHSLQFFETGGTKPKLKEIKSVTTQVVQGSLVKITATFVPTNCPKDSDNDIKDCEEQDGGEEKECKLEFWDRSWLENGLQTKIDCGDGEKTHVTNTITRKKRGIPGGPSTLPNDDPRALKYIEHSLQFFETGGTKPKLKEIKSVTTQVVQGSLVKITATFVPTNCPKDSDNDIKDCEEQDGGEEKECKLEFWDRPWLENGLQTKIDCGDGEKTHVTDTISRKKRGIPGGPSTRPDDRPIFLKEIEYSLQFFDTFDTKPQLKEIKSFNIYIAPGSLVKFTATFVPTNCPKDSDTYMNDCEVQDGGEEQECKLVFWDRPQLENGLQIKIDCGDGEKTHVTNSISRKRRDVPMPGGVIALPNDDPTALRYVHDSLQYFDTSDTKYKLKEITSVTSQVVAGSLMKVTAVFVPTTCPRDSDKEPQNCEELEGGEEKVCKFKFWDRPWLENGLQITRDCGDEVKTFTSESPFRNKESRKKRSVEDNVIDIEFGYKNLFDEFMASYNKNYYDLEEYLYRLKVFRRNMKFVEILNENEQGTAYYGPTKFADLTTEEFKQYLGYNENLRDDTQEPLPQAVIPDVPDLPTSFDWRDHNAVTEVKNQGMCGSCWAFSTTGNIEGQYAIKHGQLLEFSEQELVDCDSLDSGCNGGLMDNAYRYIEKTGGLELESEYPYEAEKEKCSFNKSKVRVELTGALNISSNETDMAKWLTQNGPISIAINANAMQFYMGGVSHPFKFLCNPNNLDHGVLIVGYGVHTYPRFKKSLPYWIVKNSWGPSWGEQGYYRVYRGDGTCGVNKTPSSAIVE